MGRYKAAVIGLGQIGLTYDLDPKRERPSSHVGAYELHPAVTLVAATDTNREQAQVLHQLAPQVAFYHSMPELLQHNEPDIISICTPPGHHLPTIQHILQQASARIIFCEKPLVSSLAEAESLKRQLQQHTGCLLVPNLSRRWNSGMKQVKDAIATAAYGELQKIHVRYTRGIFNTGTHIFDLLHWWVGKIDQVQVVEQVGTSADSGQDPSFTFTFRMGDTITGFAEAFNDRQYYLFEIDLYFSQGKIAVRNSGDNVFYYSVGEHPLFSGFSGLHPERQEHGLLREANLGNAVDNLVKVLDSREQPLCTVDDAIYPLYVAQALLQSYNHNLSVERVDWYE